MPTQPVEHKVYNYSQPQPRRPQTDVDFPLGPEQSKNRQPEETPASKSGVRTHIESLLADIPKGEDGRLSFQDVVNHKDAVEAEWDQRVSADLEALGVDMSKRFRLMLDPGTGAVTASGDHPDKMRIDAYFAANEERADEFKNIVQLGRLASVAENKLSPDDMQQTLLPQAMAWWYQTNMDTSSLFTGGGVVFGAGGSAYKGLDIRV